MGTYESDAKRLLELVGGASNIAAVTHCMTRMRFVLNDPDKADVPGIEALGSVKGSFTQGGQFQVIVGNDVAAFYNDFTAIAGIEGVSKDEAKAAAKQNQNPLQRAMTSIAEVFAPLIPAIIVGGMILGFRHCIDSIAFFEDGSSARPCSTPASPWASAGRSCARWAAPRCSASCSASRSCPRSC